MPPTAPSRAFAPFRSRLRAALASTFVFAVVLAVGCVAGVDVTDEELEALELSQGPGLGGSSPIAANGGTGATSLGGSQSSSLGGSVSGSRGGTGGSAGTGAAGVGGTGSTSPPAVGACVEENTASLFDVVVLYTDRSQDNQISMRLTVQIPMTSNGFPRSDLVLRYWFTDDGVGPFTPTFDYVNFGGGMDSKAQTTATFGNALGSNYVDIGFTDPADIGMGIAEVQMRMNGMNFATLNLANDFSYSAAAMNVENRNITAYVDGVKISGCEPAGP